MILTLSAAKTIPTKTRYRNKKNYGKVPKYLTNIKKNIETEYQTIRDMGKMQDQQMYQERFEMPKEELNALINGLK